MRLDDGKGPYRVSSWLEDGPPTNEKSFPSLKERFELQKEREVNFDTDNPQFIILLRYGIRRNYNEWSLPKSFGEMLLFNKKLNCFITISTIFSCSLTVNLTKDLNKRRLKDRIPEERKYVICSHNLNTLIKDPFPVVTAFPGDPNQISNSYHSLESFPSTSYGLTHHTSSSCSNLSQSEFVEKKSVAIQTEVETWDTQNDCHLMASLWKTEFVVAEFEQQNKNHLKKLNSLNFSLRCANISRSNAKTKTDRVKSELKISEKVTSDFFQENKEVEQQLEEATSKAESV